MYNYIMIVIMIIMVVIVIVVISGLGDRPLPRHEPHLGRPPDMATNLYNLFTWQPLLSNLFTWQPLLSNFFTWVGRRTLPSGSPSDLLFPPGIRLLLLSGSPSDPLFSTRHPTPSENTMFYNNRQTTRSPTRFPAKPVCKMECLVSRRGRARREPAAFGMFNLNCPRRR